MDFLPNSNTDAAVSSPQLQRHASGLFTFLKELTELRTQTVRDIQAYDRVLWLSDIPHEPECHCIFWQRGVASDDDEEWLMIRKPRLLSPPEPEAKLKPWLIAEEISNSSLEMPSLREQILVRKSDSTIDDDEGEPFEKREIRDYPEITDAWLRYVRERWLPWRDVDRRAQAVQRVYHELFSIYQRQQKLGEQYEVVLGMGLLLWRTPDHQLIRRHLLVAQTNIVFDAVHGIIKLGPAGDGPQLALEQEMIDPQYRPGIIDLNERISNIGDDLWSDRAIDEILAGWCNAVSAHGAYDDSLESSNVIDIHPRCYLAPAIILRKRTERSFVKVYSEIRELIHAGHPIPSGVQHFISPPTKSASSFALSKQMLQASNEIYFPLEANDQQRAIVERLATNAGVVVQGPPGTGKSHTITNLIAHLLATGQRILVTSHTDRALHVLKRYLREKMPEIAPLAVMLLGNNRDGLRAMEDSVHGIVQHYNLWDATKSQKEIARLEQELDQARREEVRLLKDLQAVREAETYRHPLRFNAYQGTLAQIARQLHEEAETIGWIDDRPKEDEEAPLSLEELEELLHLLRDTEINEVSKQKWQIPDLSQITPPNEYSQLLAEVESVSSESEQFKRHRQHPAWHTLLMSMDKTTELAQSLGQLLEQIERIDHSSQAWTHDAARQVLEGRERVWRELAEVTKKHLKELDGQMRWTDEFVVEGLDGRNHLVVRADTTELLQHLSSGKGWGTGFFRPAIVKRAAYLRDEVRIQGRPCDHPESLRLLLTWLDVEKSLQQLQRLWSPYTTVNIPSFRLQQQLFYELLDLLKEILHLRSKTDQLGLIIRQIPGLHEPAWHKIDEVRELYQLLQSAQIASRSRIVHQQLTTVIDHIKLYTRTPDAHPALTQLLQAAQERNAAAFQRIWMELERYAANYAKLSRRRVLEGRLSLRAPQLMMTLRRTASDEVWDQRLPTFLRAWDWAGAKGWIERMNDPQRESQLHLELDNSRRVIRENLRKIAAAKAWAHCIQNMTEEHRQHLVAWTKSMSKIGRGYGKYAHIHRENARKHMNGCRGAVPAWIMPLYRVAETIRPGQEMFDVAIIDEASQSGMEALLLTYLAKKIVVVGDDKQISPDNVGINRADVNQLRARHIPNIPFSEQYGIDNSFFGLAEIRFPGRIRLREHFRCMPEIIQFCNDLFYSSEPLIPLKQFGSSRLTPVIVTRYVHDGYQTGGDTRKLNRPEAEAVVQSIVECCQNPLYEGKTIGVISLLGETQAREIERLLLEQLGPEEMEKRQIVCGDAYDFQGDERDIIFLSMVVAQNQRFGTLTGERYERRFNVAVSRARDQLFLFHSVTLDNLNPNCLRYKLLEYCQNPQRTTKTVAGIDIEQLKQLATQLDRTRVKPPSPFDSWFEVEVCLRIAERGYHVIPQYEAAGYYIDLVIEGMNRRLAVECDGEYWHGPERYAEDMARQRVLERCGWIFWRVRSSTFYLDPDAAMASLWQKLQQLGIDNAAPLAV
jgi:very-short-patch-repair endonuclease